MQLINTDFLNELQDILEDEFCTLIETYVRDTNDRVGELNSAVEQADASAVYEIAHSIKGASLNIGAELLSELCLRTELAARQGDVSVAVGLLEDINARAVETCQLLQDAYLA